MRLHDLVLLANAALPLAAQNTWVQVQPGQPNDYVAMTYDSARERVVAVGGRSRELLSTWEWDGRSWITRAPVTSPPLRYGHSLAYDSQRRRVVLFGGANFSTSLSDTWEWDGDDWQQRIRSTWSMRQPVPSPPGRVDGVLATDEGRGRVVLFGGSGVPNDTWEWDGTSWTLKTAPTRPAARFWHSMAYDKRRGRVVLYGGRTGAGAYFGDTWEWDGTAWLQLAPMVAPSARALHTLAYDDVQQRVVCFGGTYSNYPVSQMFAETWLWDGGAWTQDAPVQRPAPHTGSVLVHDATRGRSVMVGFGCDTWLYGRASGLATGAIAPVGAGCAGANGVPVLAPGWPFVGNSALALDLSSVRASAACAVGLAATGQVFGLGGGCTLYLGAPAVMFPALGNAAGFASVLIAIPRSASLFGGRVHAQGFVVDPQGGPLGVACTAGAVLTLGH